MHARSDASTSNTTDGAPLPLSGIRVFDLTQGVAGPYCTMMLAAQGADVIKVEPFTGDWLRASLNRYRGHAAGIITCNVGKRSLALDLKQPEARQVAQRVAAGCDIVMESFRPGVADKLGLGHQTLSAQRPQLIYASISGYGSHGPLRDRGAVDQIMQAFSGWMPLNADADGNPQRTRNVVLADQIMGLYAYQAISTALIGQLRHGRGAHLEMSLVGAMAAFLATRITTHVLSDGSAGNVYFAAPTGEYPTRDGILMLAMRKPSDYGLLCGLIGRADLKTDSRFATPDARAEHARELEQEIRASLSARTAIEWEALLNDAGFMACAMRTVGEFIETPQVRALGLVETVDLDGMAACPLVRLPGAPAWADKAGIAQIPHIGQHSREILRETGYTDTEIEHYLATQCVREFVDTHPNPSTAKTRHAHPSLTTAV